jgi:small-conductance mechanosensitive channel
MAFLETANNWLALVTTWLVTPVLIVLLGVFLGKVLEQVLLFLGDELAPRSRYAPLGAYAAGWLVYFAAFVYALYTIGVLRVAALLFFGLIGLVVFAHIILASIEIVRNALAFTTVRSRWRPSALVDSPLVRGVVAHVGLTATRVITSDGDVLSVPNRTMISFSPPARPVVIKKK